MKESELSYFHNLDMRKKKIALLSQIFLNFKGMKALYKEGSLRCIIWIDKIEITDEMFSARAKLLSLIDEFNHKDENKIPREWTFNSVYETLTIDKAGLNAPYLWEIWTDQNFIAEIERLVLEKKFRHVNFKMAVFKNS